MIPNSSSEQIRVSWLVEDQILQLQIGGSEDGTDGEPETNFDAAILRYLDVAAHTLHLVVLLNPVQSHPPAARLLSMKHPRHPRMGYIVVVNRSATPMARFFMSLVGNLRGVRLKSASTLDEALSFLKTLEPSSS